MDPAEGKAAEAEEMPPKQVAASLDMGMKELVGKITGQQL